MSRIVSESEANNGHVVVPIHDTDVCTAMRIVVAAAVWSVESMRRTRRLVIAAAMEMCAAQCH